MVQRFYGVLRLSLLRFLRSAIWFLFSAIFQLFVLLVLGWGIYYAYLWYQTDQNQHIRLKDLEKADAAIVLGAWVGDADDPYSCTAGRIKAGVELWKAGKVKELVMTGKAQSADMRKYAISLGVPSSVILSENHSTDTYENYQYSDPLLTETHANSLIIVSNAYHLQRARWMAEAYWPEKTIQIYAAPSHCFDRMHKFHILYETLSILKNGLQGRYFTRTTE